MWIEHRFETPWELVRLQPLARSRTRSPAAKDPEARGNPGLWERTTPRDGRSKTRRQCTPIVVTTHFDGIVAQSVERRAGSAEVRGS